MCQQHDTAVTTSEHSKIDCLPSQPPLYLSTEVDSYLGNPSSWPGNASFANLSFSFSTLADSEQWCIYMKTFLALPMVIALFDR